MVQSVSPLSFSAPGNDDWVLVAKSGGHAEDKRR